MISGYFAQDKALFIPDELDGKPVTAVMQQEDRYLSSAEKISTVHLPSGLKVIGDRAFYRFSALRTLTVPSGLEEIGDGAFYNVLPLPPQQLCTHPPHDQHKDAFYPARVQSHLESGCLQHC